MASYAADTWYTPITIDALNNGLVITEDPAGAPNVITIRLDGVDYLAGAAAASVPSRGVYFQHDDSSWHTTRKGLLYAIQKLLNDGTTAGVGSVTGTATFTYSWETSAPTGSTGLTDGGLTLRTTAPGSDFEITWTDAASTMDAQWFGHTLIAPVADQLSTTDASDEIIQWARASKHRMVTRDVVGDGIATDKRRFPYKDARRSSSRPKDSTSVVWDEGFVRRFLYENVGGQEIHEDRASEAEWADLSGRATGDNHAVWWLIWEALTDDAEVLVVHNKSDDLQVDANFYELGKLWQSVAWDAMFSRVEAGADIYDVSVPLWVDPDSSNYNH